MVVNQVDRFANLACHMQQDAVAGKRRVQRRERTFHRVLAVCLQHATDIARPVNVSLRGLRQPFDCYPFKGQIIACLGIKDTVDKHNQLETNIQTIYTRKLPPNFVQSWI